MASDETQPMGQSQQQLIKVLHNNTSQQLNRHVETNGTIETDVADFILKKGDYTNTYIAIDTSGLPDGVTLILCDENSNPLYSPVDTNHNWQTTLCSITVGETDIIPLPAQFNNQLSAHTPFPIGTYNWKLKFNETNDYYGEEIPLTVEIRDFKVWEIQTPQIYPNENITVQLKTYADTYYPDNSFTNLLSTNATYDSSTGIITYPNSDINDLSLGKHMQIINQASNCFIDYEVMNPIEFYHEGDAYYSAEQKIGYTIKQRSLVTTNGPAKNYNILINGQHINTEKYGIKTPSMYNVYTDLFPPGTYHCVVPTITTSNGETYTCEGDFTISTENCSLNLQYENAQTTIDLMTLSTNNEHNIQTSGYVSVGNGIMSITSGCTFQPIPCDKIREINVRYIGGSTYSQIQQYSSEHIPLKTGTYSINNNICTYTDENGNITTYPWDGENTDVFSLINNSTSLYREAQYDIFTITYDDDNKSYLSTTYQYNDTPIPNARIGLINAHTNVLLETAVSDEQGKCIWTTTEPGICKSVAYDMRTNEVILESNIIAPLVYNVDIDNNGDLIINKYDNISGSSISVTDSITDDEGDLLISTTQYNSINDVEDAIYSIDIDENGDIYYNTIGE